MNVVLDASAVLATILDEAGGYDVFEAKPSAEINAVNLSEVYAKLIERGADFEDTQRLIGRFEFSVRTFDVALMLRTARLRPLTRSLGLSFADRACIALGQVNDWPILTSDRRMAESGPVLDMDIRLIR